MNPIDEIPAIDLNGFHLEERCGIAQYPCDKYATDDNLYPKDAHKRAQVNRMEFFAGGSLWPALSAQY